MANGKRNRNKKTSTTQLSQKAQPPLRRNKDVPLTQGTTLNVVSSKYEDMVKNMLEPDVAFLLPRAIPNTCGVMHEKAVKTLSFDLQESPYGAAILRPSVYDMLELATYSSEAVGGSFDLQYDNENDADDLTSATYSFAPVLQTGSSTVRPVLYDAGAIGASLVLDVDESADKYAGKLEAVSLPPSKIYGFQGPWSIPSNNLVFTSSVRHSGTVTVQVRGYHMVDGVWTSTGNGTVQTLINGTSSSIVTYELGSMINNAGTAFAMTFTFAFTGNTQEGFSFSVASAAPWTLATGNTVLKWQKFSFFDLLGVNAVGVDTLKTQFDSSQRHCMTGFSVCLQNTTPEIYQGGSMSLAQLPGDSYDTLPLDDISVLKSYISSRNDGKNDNPPLSKGGHYSYIPEKIQDYFFSKTTADPNLSLPYCVAAWKAPLTEAVQALELTLIFKINLEIITTDISVTKFRPSPDYGNVVDLIIMLMQEFNPCSHNPNHLQKIKTIASSVVKSPMFKKTMSELVKYGVKSAPLLLSLLA